MYDKNYYLKSRTRILLKAKARHKAHYIPKNPAMVHGRTREKIIEMMMDGYDKQTIINHLSIVLGISVRAVRNYYNKMERAKLWSGMVIDYTHYH